jgi:hypothetical protein
LGYLAIFDQLLNYQLLFQDFLAFVFVFDELPRFFVELLVFDQKALKKNNIVADLVLQTSAEILNHKTLFVKFSVFNVAKLHEP